MVKSDKEIELDLIKTKPIVPIDLNSYKEFTRYEKICLLISSKTFIVIASILTLGFYYLYYRFCLEQEHKSPFNTKRIYEWEKSKKDYDCWHVSEQFNKRFKNLFSPSFFYRWYGWTKKQLIKFYRKFLVDSGVAIWSTFTSAAVNVGSVFRGGFITGTKVAQHKSDLLSTVREEEKKEQSNLEVELTKLEGGFNLDKPLIQLMTEDYSKVKKNRVVDYFLFINVVIGYVLVSILTLGWFPFYHFHNKKAFDFNSVKRYRENVEKHDFNVRIGRLFDDYDNSYKYSEGLFSAIVFENTVTSFSDSFRTKRFKDNGNRSIIGFLLVFITSGIFVFFILGLVSYYSEKEKELENPLGLADKDKAWVKSDSYFDKVKNNIKDFKWDLLTYTEILVYKECKLKNVFDDVIENTRDVYFKKFLSFVCNPYFRFSTSIAAVFLPFIISFIFASTPISIFIVFLVFPLFALFLISFCQHMNLLFS